MILVNLNLVIMILNFQNNSQIIHRVIKCLLYLIIIDEILLAIIRKKNLGITSKCKIWHLILRRKD
jgi:hypothetical protein